MYESALKEFTVFTAIRLCDIPVHMLHVRCVSECITMLHLFLYHLCRCEMCVCVCVYVCVCTHSMIYSILSTLRGQPVIPLHAHTHTHTHTQRYSHPSRTTSQATARPSASGFKVPPTLHACMDTHEWLLPTHTQRPQSTRDYLAVTQIPSSHKEYTYTHAHNQCQVSPLFGF